MKIYRYFLIPLMVLTIAHISCNPKAHDHDHHHDHEHDHDHDHDHDDDEIVFTVEQAEAAGLETEKIDLSDFHQVVRTSGQINAALGDEVSIVATTNGIVSFSNMQLTEGSAIRNGESILTISSKNLLEGDPTLRARSEYETAKLELERADKLIEDKIISEKEYQAIKLRYENAKAIYSAQSGNITSKGIKVTSPIQGYIKSKLVNEGDFVNIGQPIITVTKNRKLQLKADISEKHYKDLKNIKTAHFKTAYDTTLYKLSDLNGRLLSYGKGADNSSYYIPLYFEFDNKGEIVPGVFTEIYLITNPIQDIITVPVSSLTEDQGVYFVYLRTGQEVYMKQEVKVGHSDGNRVWIKSGLNKGDEIVTKGVYQVKIAANASLIPEGHTH